MCLRRIFLFASVAVLTLCAGPIACSALAAEGDEQPIVVIRSGEKNYVGKFVSEDEQGITIIDLITRRPVTIGNGDFRSVTRVGVAADSRRRAVAASDGDVQESAGPIAVEVIVLETSDDLEFTNPSDIDRQTLKQAIEDAKASGVLKHETRFRFSTLSGQQTVMQMTSQEHFISGWQQTGLKGADRIPIYQASDTGTVLGIEAESWASDEIMVSIDLEQSRLVPGGLEDTETEKLDFPKRREFSMKNGLTDPRRKDCSRFRRSCEHGG